MRALSDQMESAPPQVQELRAALAVYRRAADEWRERALKAEAALEHCGELLGRSEAELAKHNDAWVTDETMVTADNRISELEAVNEDLRQRLSLGEDDNLRLVREVARLRREQSLDDLNEEGWKVRARKAEAEVARLRDDDARGAPWLKKRVNDLEAEVTRLRAVLIDVYRVWIRDGRVSSAVIDDVRAALVKGGGDGG